MPMAVAVVRPLLAHIAWRVQLASEPVAAARSEGRKKRASCRTEAESGRGERRPGRAGRRGAGGEGGSHARDNSRPCNTEFVARPSGGGGREGLGPLLHG